MITKRLHFLKTIIRNKDNAPSSEYTKRIFRKNLKKDIKGITEIKGRHQINKVIRNYRFNWGNSERII